jgi:Heavy metal binding domain
MNATEKKYACPMHPEIQGKFNDKCSECGMLLTIPVPEYTYKQDLKTIDIATSVQNCRVKNLTQNNQI